MEHLERFPGTNVDFAAGGQARIGANGKRVFLLALLLSTWVPMIFFIFFAQVATPSFSLNSIKTLLVFFGTAHVQATLFFYTDKDFRHLVRENKRRYVYLPLLLIVGAGLVFLLAGPLIQACVLFFYWAWQAFHYGRQNVGIYAFVSISETGKSAPKLERLCLEAATYCGMLGTLKVLGMGIAPIYLRGFFGFLFQSGFYLFLVLFAFSLFIYLQNLGAATATKTLFFLTLILFFFPMYLSNNPNVTFLSYAIAHGMQYLVFMAVVSANSDRSAFRKRLNNILKLGACVLFVGFAFMYWGKLKEFDLVRSSAMLLRLMDFLLGAVLGTTMAHFVIDAGAWRLTKASTRAYVKDRFGFVFKDDAAVLVPAPAGAVSSQV
jgi:hypothetical protein